MSVAARPYAAAGVALVSAGLIAAAPVITPLPELHMADIELTGLADLDLVGPWVDVFNGTVTNVSQIAGDMLEFPVPALTQLGSNLLGYGNDFVGALGVAGGSLIDTLGALPETLGSVFTELTAGNIAGAYGLLSEGVLMSGLPLAFPLISIMESLTDVTQNLANVTVAGGGMAIGLATSSLGVLLAAGAALADSGQLFVDGLTGSDPLAALGALLNAPAAFTGGLLNGFESAFPGGFVGAGGLLSSLAEPLGEGPLSGLLVELPQALAGALGWDGTSSVFDGLLDFTGSLGKLLDPGNITSLFDGFDLSFLTDSLSALSFDGLAGLFDFGSLLDMLNPMTYIQMIMNMFI